MSVLTGRGEVPQETCSDSSYTHTCIYGLYECINILVTFFYDLFLYHEDTAHPHTLFFLKFDLLLYIIVNLIYHRIFIILYLI